MALMHLLTMSQIGPNEEVSDCNLGVIHTEDAGHMAPPLFEMADVAKAQFVKKNAHENNKSSNLCSSLFNFVSSLIYGWRPWCDVHQVLWEVDLPQCVNEDYLHVTTASHGTFSLSVVA